MKKGTASHLTKRRKEKFKEQFALRSLEIAGLTQTLIKRRIERALFHEEELDAFMKELLSHSEACGDKTRSRAILSRFEAIRIEDITKLASLVKSMYSMDDAEEDAQIKTEQIKMKFEDYYE